jgi:hypothetical protein
MTRLTNEKARPARSMNTRFVFKKRTGSRRAAHRIMKKARENIEKTLVVPC